MGPGALWHQRGPWVLRLCEENVWHTSVQPQGRYGTWPLRFDPAVMLKLSAAQRGVSSCSHLTLRRDLASKVACLIRWRHAPLQEWADGLLSAFLRASR